MTEWTDFAAMVEKADATTDWHVVCAMVALREGLILCAVCHTPIFEDPGMRVERDDGSPAMVHYDFPCMDEPRCEVVINDSRCVLPTTHLNGHLPATGKDA